jgi:chromosome segregation ATPase
MLDWVKLLIAGVGGGSAFAAIWAVTLRYFNARAKHKRLVRADEVEVLHQAIDELRKDRDEVKIELAEVKVEMNTLRSEHTACLLEQQRLRDELKRVEGRANGKNTPR